MLENITVEQKIIQLHPADTVGIALRDLDAGMDVKLPDGRWITLQEAVPAGHKVALRSIAPGEALLRYGCRIGQASTAIQPGAWVHSHNLEAGELAQDYSWRVVEPHEARPSGRTFMGYPRADGRAGTRNYIAVIATVNCASAVTSHIARAFTPERLAAYPNVDGVAAVVHSSGCSLAPDSLSLKHLRRTLANLAHNPNVAAALYVGLGCEVNQLSECLPVFSLEEMSRLAGPGLAIQEQGGFRRTVEAGIAVVEGLLEQVNAIRRVPQPLSRLSLALQCGGSDGWSGVTANPLVGRVSDRLAREGGTAVLSETPEIFGAERFLLERVASPEVGRRLAERFEWWVEHARQRGFSLDNNPSPGNKKGGLTTIYEKSLGAAAKGGSTPLAQVCDYAETVSGPGLVFMDTPGNDPVSVTGQIAGGCNLIVFTTGRGTVYGSNLAPCVKVASNSALYQRMPEDMDFNAGRLLEGLSWEEAEEALLDRVVSAASGERTCSELHGLPEGEFSPWLMDGVL